MNISWKAHEYIHREKTSDWYWIVGIVGVTAAIVSILLGNALFAVVILLGTFVIAMYGSHPPKLINYQLTDRGLVIDENLYQFSTLESFWIDNTRLPSRLIIRSHKMLMPMIVISIEGVRDEQIREILEQHLREEELHEPIGQVIFEYFGF